MPTLNFKKQFADMVADGQKKQTIRATRKRPFKIGDTVYLFTGLRTRATVKLGEAMVIKVSDIEILFDLVIIDGKEHALESLYLEKFVRQDGFVCVPDFMAFFLQTYGLPFKGQIINWDYPAT